MNPLIWRFSPISKHAINILFLMFRFGKKDLGYNTFFLHFLSVDFIFIYLFDVLCKKNVIIVIMFVYLLLLSYFCTLL